MKFTCSVIVDRSLNEVIELFEDPSNLKEYQDGFLRKELVSGVEGQVGTVSKMYYKNGGQEMEITETIVVNNLPEEFLGEYHHEHMDNTMKCYFVALNDNQTQYYTEIDYTAFRGFIPKVMGYFFPGIFKRQVQKWLDNFKAFAERSSDN